MKFILMMHAPRGTGDWDILTTWSQGAVEAHMQHFNEINAELRKAGELVSIEGLTPPKQARIVRARKGHAPDVTDGPFAESKEFLAGYWIIDVATPERAYAIAGRASAAPGPDGQPLNMAIEVREVMSGPPKKD